MGDLEDFYRDFLPRFIDAQRAFTMGIQNRILPCDPLPTR
jgi:hypothetical protein